jgi:thioesterase domain-containing protein
MADAPYPFLESPESLADRIQRTWDERIPLTQHMGVRIERLDADGLILAAPLAPNVNHMGTGFGGSLASVATLTGWGLTQVLTSHLEDVHVVVRESRLRYRATVTEDFTAYCAFPAAAVIDAFREQLGRKQRARIQLQVELTAAGRCCLSLDGDFAAFVGV